MIKLDDENGVGGIPIWIGFHKKIIIVCNSLSVRNEIVPASKLINEIPKKKKNDYTDDGWHLCHTYEKWEENGEIT